MNFKTILRFSVLFAILAIPNFVRSQPPRAPYVISPKVNADKTVTFSYLAPNATTVLLGGGQFGFGNVNFEFQRRLNICYATRLRGA